MSLSNIKLGLGIPFVLMACGGENVIESKQNTAPIVVIASHSPDAEILEGYAETFRATVSDDDNEFEELSVAWYVVKDCLRLGNSKSCRRILLRCYF